MALRTLRAGIGLGLAAVLATGSTAYAASPTMDAANPTAYQDGGALFSDEEALKVTLNGALTNYMHLHVKNGNPTAKMRKDFKWLQNGWLKAQTRLNISNYSLADVTGPVQQTDVQPVNFLVSTLRNDGPQEQTLTSAEFAKQVTDTVTTTTTHGWKVGTATEVSAEFKVEFVAKLGGKISLSAEYNGSRAVANTKTTTQTITASRQVKVPAGQTAVVEGVLSQTQVTGQVAGKRNFTSETTLMYPKDADAGRWVPQAQEWGVFNTLMSLAYVPAYMSNYPSDVQQMELGFRVPDNVTYDGSSDQATMNSKGTFQAIAGTGFDLRVTFKDNNTGQPVSDFVIPNDGETVKVTR